MPAPFDYSVQRPDIMGAIGAYEAGRDRNRQVMQQGKQDMFAQYLPGALKGDQEAQGQAMANATPEQTMQLTRALAEMDDLKLQQTKAQQDKFASLAQWADTPEKWMQATQMAEADGMKGASQVPFEQRGAKLAGMLTVKEQLDQEWKRREFALQERNVNSQIGERNGARQGGSGLGGMNNTTFDNISGLRKEYINATKDFGTVADAYSRIKATSAAATPAGDLSMIYAYMKMLDPGSVVRESEFALAGNAKPLIDRMGLSWDAVKSTWEGTKLQPQVRADFLKQAAALYGQQVEQKGLIDGQYTDLSRDFGFDPKFVVTGRAGQTPPPAATDLPPPPPGARIMP